MSRYADSGIMFHENTTRTGKIGVLNATVPMAQGDVVVFSDASAILDQNAVTNLVNHFHNAEVGCVSGRYVFDEAENTTTNSHGSEGLYWKYESFIKERENEIGNVIGSHGALYGIRKEIYSPLEDEIINDDLVLPLMAIEKSYRTVYEKDSIARERTGSDIESEFYRRVRIMRGNCRQIRDFLRLLNPLRGMVCVQFLSHKLLRVLSPFFVLGLLLASIFSSHPFFRYALLGQGVFYTLALLGGFHGKGESDLHKLAELAPDRASWEKRREIIKHGILEGANLLPLPKKTPLNPVRHSLRKYSGYQIENVYFESLPGFYVTGSLYMPLELQDSCPVILKPHGHLKNKRYTIDNQMICASFAQMGYIVFTYDMVGYSDSIQVEHKIKNAFTLQTWNSIRSLDFILSLPHIDPERIGMTGGSGGGTQTFMCAALDDRVKASAPVVMVSSFFYGGCVCESGLPVHKGRDYKTNNAEIAAIAAPRPQLMISDGADWTRLVPVLEFPFIKHIYGYYKAEDKVENAHFPNEIHNYGPSKRQASYEFFSRIFNISYKRNENGEFDEKDCVFEEESLLKVFTDVYPLPTNALKTEMEIIDTLKSLQ